MMIKSKENSTYEYDNFDPSSKNIFAIAFFVSLIILYIMLLWPVFFSPLPSWSLFTIFSFCLFNIFFLGMPFVLFLFNKTENNLVKTKNNLVSCLCYIKGYDNKFMIFDIYNSDVLLFLCHLEKIKQYSKSKKEFNRNLKKLVKLNKKKEFRGEDKGLSIDRVSQEMIYIDCENEVYMATENSINPVMWYDDQYNKINNTKLYKLSFLNKLIFLLKPRFSSNLNTKNLDLDFDFKLYDSKSVSSLLKLYRDLILEGYTFSKEEKNNWKDGIESLIAKRYEDFGGRSNFSYYQKKACKKYFDYIDMAEVIIERKELWEKTEVGKKEKQKNLCL